MRQRAHLVALGVRFVRKGESVALDEVGWLVRVEVDGEDYREEVSIRRGGRRGQRCEESAPSWWR